MEKPPVSNQRRCVLSAVGQMVQSRDRLFAHDPAAVLRNDPSAGQLIYPFERLHLLLKLGRRLQQLHEMLAPHLEGPKVCLGYDTGKPPRLMQQAEFADATARVHVPEEHPVLVCPFVNCCGSLKDQVDPISVVALVEDRGPLRKADLAVFRCASEQTRQSGAAVLVLALVPVGQCLEPLIGRVVLGDDAPKGGAIEPVQHSALDGSNGRLAPPSPAGDHRLLTERLAGGQQAQYHLVTAPGPPHGLDRTLSYHVDRVGDVAFAKKVLSWVQFDLVDVRQEVV